MTDGKDLLRKIRLGDEPRLTIHAAESGGST